MLGYCHLNCSIDVNPAEMKKLCSIESLITEGHVAIH